MTREQLLSETFVALADTLVDDFDMVEFLSLLSERCVKLFDAEAAGVMLAGAPGGTLQLMASSSERMRLIELFELQGDEGPCPECYRSGSAVGEADLETTSGRWPAFSRGGAESRVPSGARRAHASSRRGDRSAQPVPESCRYAA